MVISELGLPKRATNAIKRNGIGTIEQLLIALLAQPEENAYSYLTSMDGVGKKMAAEVLEKLHNMGHIGKNRMASIPVDSYFYEELRRLEHYHLQELARIQQLLERNGKS